MEQTTISLDATFILVRNLLTKVEPSLPKLVQEQSFFLRLPVEIRLIILRELLCSPDVLNERQTYESPRPNATLQTQTPSTKKRERASLPRKAKQKVPADKTQVSTAPKTETVKGYHLYPVVLRCSQRLLDDGLAILYRENTLGLVVHDSTDSDGNWYPQDPVRLAIYACKEDPIFHISDYRSSLGSSYVQDLAYKFGRFNVEVCTFDYYYGSAIDHTGSFIGYLQTLFANCYVRVVIMSNGMSAEMTDAMDRLLQGFKRLRCSDMVIEGVLSELAESIVKIATSREPVINLFPSFESPGLKEIKFFLDECSRRTKIWRHLPKFKELGDAATEGDVVRFRKVRAEIFEMADDEGRLRLEKMKNDACADDVWK